MLVQSPSRFLSWRPIVIEFLSLASVKSLLECLKLARENTCKRKDNQEKIFEEVIAPIYVATEKIVDDYMGFLSTLVISIRQANERKDVSAALEIAQQMRIKLLPQRVMIREEAQELAQSIHDASANKFLRSVTRIFFPNQYKNGRQMSRSITALHFIEDYQLHFDNKDLLITDLQKLIDDLEEKWVAVVQSYARLRIREIVRRQSRVGSSVMKIS